MLTITGEISHKNTPDRVELDLETLKSFEKTVIETTTIWTDGKQVFEGVALSDLIDELGMSGTTLRVTSINDYTVDIPVSEVADSGAIIAYSRNGSLMSVREKGPLWIIYPFDSDRTYRSEVIYSRSIWQLDRIEIIG